jgi:hypothetical protein
MLRPTDIVMFIQSMKTDLTNKEKEIYLMMWRQLFVDRKALTRLFPSSGGLMMRS